MVKTQRHDNGILELSISNPPVNLMDIDTLTALKDFIDNAKHNQTRGIVISGQPGFFSSGIDIFNLIRGDKELVEDYWRAVFELATSMALTPTPIVAAITGHCIASGTLIAAFADYRIAGNGNWHIGLNEVQAGIALPECFQMSIRRIIGPHRAGKLLMFGDLLSPQQALEIGFVDELVAQERVSGRAIERLTQLLRLPADSMQAIRKTARADLAQAFVEPAKLPVTAFTEHFLSPDVQGNLRSIALDLQQRMKTRHAETC
jgi:Delta3-Delta2-enoyl-CoA isomerase